MRTPHSSTACTRAKPLQDTSWHCTLELQHCLGCHRAVQCICHCEHVDVQIGGVGLRGDNSEGCNNGRRELPVTSKADGHYMCFYRLQSEACGSNTTLHQSLQLLNPLNPQQVLISPSQGRNNITCTAALVCSTPSIAGEHHTLIPL